MSKVFGKFLQIKDEINIISPNDLKINRIQHGIRSSNR